MKSRAYEPSPPRGPQEPAGTERETSVPGFVDLQVNGYLGTDFSDANLAASDVVGATRALRDAGTVAFLATFVTLPPDLLRRNIAVVLEACREPDVGSVILGFHVEGPFIDPRPGARGAHNEKYVRAPDVALFEDIYAWAQGKLRLFTVAAGVPGVEAVISAARHRGVAVSVGHHLSDRAALDEAVSAGATLHTHLGNGIPNTLPRTDNPIFHALANDRLAAMIITDGHHTPPSFIETVLKVKKPANTIIVSDQSSVAGLPPGEYRTLGNRAILDSSGRLYNPDSDHLVGSASTILQCVNHLASLGLCSSRELITMALRNPLRAIGTRGRFRSRPPRYVFESGAFRQISNA